MQLELLSIAVEAAANTLRAQTDGAAADSVARSHTSEAAVLTVWPSQTATDEDVEAYLDALQAELAGSAAETGREKIGPEWQAAYVPATA